MVVIRVKPHSYLNVYLSGEQARRILELGFPEPPTVARVVEYLKLPREEVLLITINKRKVSWETRVHPGDLVELYPTIGGG